MIKRISVIGTGNWGQVVIKKFHKLGVLHLVYGQTNRAQLKAFGVSFTEDISFLIRDSDAVVIATPPATHVSLARKVLMENKDLLLEKPMATSLLEAQYIVDYAKEKSSIFMIGHTLCYSEGYEKLRMLSGEPIFGKARFLKTFDQEKILNPYWNLGVHMIALASLLGLSAQQLTLEVSVQAQQEERTFELTTQLPNGATHSLLYDFLEARKSDDMLMEECKSFLDYICGRTIPRTNGLHGLETIKMLEYFSPEYKK